MSDRFFCLVFFLQQLKEQKNAGNRTNEVCNSNLVHKAKKTFKYLRQCSIQPHKKTEEIHDQ